MVQVKAVLVAIFLMTIIERNQAAFKCYKCNDCGETWNPSVARIALTETGGSYCTKRVSNGIVTKDYSTTCPEGDGIYCCQSDLCNSSQTKYLLNLSLLGFVLFGTIFAHL